MKPLVIGIGELLWDLLPSGPRMGGAPANFACHARALGANAQIVSQVGDDDAGARLLRNLLDLGLSVSGISIDLSHPTGSVDVRLRTDGQPEFTINPDGAWDHLMADPQLGRLFTRADAVCFGTLAQRSAVSAATIRHLVALTPPEALRVLDVNFRQNHFSTATVVASLELANVLKVNEEELPKIAGMLAITGTPREMLAALLSRFALQLIAWTRGGNGSVLYDGRDYCEHPGFLVDVCDTIGAGDSFTAAVTMGLLHGWPMDRISEIATEVSAHVCSCAGAVPVLPEPIRKRFQLAAAGHDGVPS